MISKAADVDTYVAEVPAERRPAIERLRKLIRQSLPGTEECMEYGMPCYKRQGAQEVSFASQKQYIALYVNPALAHEFRDALGAASMGKSCIRFTRPEQMDFEVLGQLLRKVIEYAPGSRQGW
jgi:uncharacterized protein YdhG (YjbR/CyaY superfamily)